MKMIKKKEEKEVKKELFLKKALLEAQRNLQDIIAPKIGPSPAMFKN